MVSSELDYINKYPKEKVTFGRIEHELQHIKIREKISSFTTLASTTLLILALAGIIGGGMFSVGALAAIAFVSAIYAMAAREAESSLRSKQVQWMNGGAPAKGKVEEEAKASYAEQARQLFGLDWFSKAAG